MLKNNGLLYSICIALCVLCVAQGYSFAWGEFAYDDLGRRNPFIPLITNDGRLIKLDQVHTTASLAVEGIVYDKYGSSYAVVNGEVLMIGDKIGDYQVLKIEQKKVILIKEGQPYEVELKEEP